ncbi:MAG: ScyD/ScyE family protein [Phycisphaerales bacterium]|nr:ScyD/ScyE family protein [Phycisphaerales bacterium]
MNPMASLGLLTATLGLTAGLSLAGVPIGGGGAELVQSGLAGPLGLEVDNRARAWLSQMGPPVNPGSGSISWFYVDQMTASPNAFITDYPVAINPFNGEAAGVAHVAIAANGNLLLAAGGPAVHPMLGGAVRYDTTPAIVEGQSHAPDGAPLLEMVTTAPYATTIPGVTESNTYSIAEDNAGNLYVADAGANAIIKIDNANGSLSTFAVFPDSNINVQSVPTRMISVPNDGSPGATAFVIVELTGVPFFANEARVWGATNDGTLSILASGLSTLVDCELDEDGSLLVCSAGQFDFVDSIFAPGTGAIQRVNLATGAVSTVRSGLWLPTGIEVIGGDIYFCTFYEGNMYRFDPANWPEYCDTDVNRDGAVDVNDILLLLEDWGNPNCAVNP